MDETQFTEQLSELSRLIRLDPNAIEFTQIKDALLFALAKREGIVGFIDADTITFLVDAIASVGTYMQYSTDLAWGEGNIHTARLEDSVRAIIRTLGVRQKRKTPATGTALFSRDPTGALPAFNIPAYTQFETNGVYYFNRDEIHFDQGEVQQNGTLYQGELRRSSFTGNGDPFLRYRSSEKGFVVSDDDVVMDLNNNFVNITKLPLWNFKNGASIGLYVQDFTLSDGSLELRFGNNLFGFSPLATDTLSITYAITQGKDGRSNTFLDAQLTSTEVPSITAQGTSVLSGGSDEIDVATYKNIGPLAFSAQSRAVDDAGYKVVPMEYPGVTDALALRQAYYAPNDIRYANFVKVSLLADTVIDTAWWDAFVVYMERKGLKTAKYIRDDPIAVDFTVNAKVYVSNDANQEAIKAQITANLNKLTEPRFGLLRLNIYKSDVYDTIANSSPNINFVELSSPVKDVLTELTYPEVSDETIDTGAGALLEGNYQYYVTVETTQGESLPKLISTNSILVNNGDTVTVNYTLTAPSYGNVSIYRARAFGGSTTYEKLVDNQAVSGTLVLADTGLSGTVVPELPLIDTSGVFYPNITNVTLETLVTDRDFITR